ncbi:MAG: transposase, partial [Dethiobacter sp.]|nr:transposase [Dethiobacter sp.]
MGTVQGLDRNQIFMPSSLDESIAADNPVRVLDALVDSLDLRKLGFPEPSAIGRPSYAANDLLKLYLYGYLHDIRSSRKLEAELLRNVELIWMLRRLKPDHKTIADFRRKNPKPFQKAFREFVAILDGWGLLGKEVFAIDGT